MTDTARFAGCRAKRTGRAICPYRRVRFREDVEARSCRRESRRGIAGWPRAAKRNVLAVWGVLLLTPQKTARFLWTRNRHLGITSCQETVRRWTGWTTGLSRSRGRLTEARSAVPRIRTAVRPTGSPLRRLPVQRARPAVPPPVPARPPQAPGQPGPPAAPRLARFLLLHAARPPARPVAMPAGRTPPLQPTVRAPWPAMPRTVRTAGPRTVPVLLTGRQEAWDIFRLLRRGPALRGVLCASRHPSPAAAQRPASLPGSPRRSRP